MKKKLSILDFKQMKKEAKKITMVTAYDYAMMCQVNKAEIDMVLVGDSAAMTMLGYEGTVPITMDTMLIFCQAVSRAGRDTFLVGDMPFMSYEVSVEKAIENAGRLIKEGFMDSIKLEGGERVAKTVEAIVKAGIPVMGHIGLTPQSAAQLGGFKVQGNNVESAKQTVKDALALEQAGVFAMILEAVPTPIAKLISEKVAVPTVGIGAGTYCDGQVLVIHDLLGLFDRFVPKFVKQYHKLGEEILQSLNKFSSEVRQSEFPGKEHAFSINDDVMEQVVIDLKNERIL